MKKIITLLAFILGFSFYLFSQEEYLFDENMAVFYPADFNPALTLPSFAVERELARVGDVPAGWEIKPVYSTEGGKVTVKISYAGEVSLYGTGEVTGSLLRNGKDVTLWNTDNLGYRSYDGKQLYQSHPWIMGVRPDGSCFGIIADHTYRQRIELNNPVKITSEGPSFRVIVIERDSPQEMMKALGDLTGKINLPPLWALGYNQSRYSYSYSEAATVADDFRTKQIPCDVIWMDIGHMDGNQPFTFSGDPIGLNRYLNDNKFKSIYIVDPAINPSGEANLFVKNSSGNVYTGRVWPGNCAFPDFTRPETRSWWKGMQINHLQNEMDGIWNDMNEPTVFDVPGLTMPDDNRHAGGGNLPAGSHLRYHNVYGMLMVQTTYSALLEARPGKRPFVLSRSNFLGGQKYAATWTGDNGSNEEYMKLSIPMSITLGLSGQPFSGPDIGGYSGNAPADLFGQWIALSAYYPFARNHTETGTVRQEPWSFGTEIENVSRTAIGRRYRLLPYTYTLFQESSKTGMPVMRPVFFADITDLNLRDEEKAFLLGGDLLIRPHWAPDAKLPQGNWKKWKMEDTEDGYQADVLVRAGAIVPVLENVIQSTEDYNTNFITLILNPNDDRTAYGKLYDDAGNGFGYQSGDYAIHEFTSIKEGDRLKIEIAQTEGNRTVNRQYRIGYVACGDVIYSEYSPETTQYVDFIKDNATMFVAASWANESIEMHSEDCGATWSSNYMSVGAGAQQMIFTELSDFSGKLYGNATGNSGTAIAITNAANVINLDIPGNGMYKVFFNEATGEYRLAIQTIPAKYNFVTIVGSATAAGWTPQGTAATNFTQDAYNPNIWTWTGILTGGSGAGEGEFKIHLYSGQWCDGDWIMATVQNQSIGNTAFNIFSNCDGEKPENGGDAKWKVSPLETGQYDFKIDFENNTLTIMPHIIDGLNEINAPQLELYCDNITGQLYLKNSEGGKATVSIYSSIGQQIKREVVEGFENMIKIDENLHSILLINVLTGKNSQTFKVLVK